MNRYIKNPLIEEFIKHKLIDGVPTEIVGVCRDNKEVNVLFDSKSKCYFLDKVDLELTNYTSRFDESYLKIGNEWKDENQIEDKQEIRDNERRKNLVFKYLFDRKDPSLIDLGAGSGSFIRLMQSEIPNLSAVEPNVGLRNLIKKTCSPVAIYENIQEIDKEFDVVTLFHVIEHLSDPFSFLSQIKRITKPQGFVLIETPSSQDALLHTYNCKSFRDHTFWTEHLVIYSPEVLGKLCSQYFSDFKIIPTQRYNLANHLYWLSNGKPGGHDYFKDHIGEELNDFYTDRLRKNDSFDTIVSLVKP